MKKLLKLIWLEASFFRRTLSVIFVILTAFGSAFLAVLSVMFDTPLGMYIGLDSSKRYYARTFGGECLALSVNDASADVADKYEAELCYGIEDGVTQNVTLSYGDRQFASDLVTQLGSEHSLEYRVPRHGYIVPLLYAEGYSSNCILLCKEIASELDVDVGDVVSVGDRKFAVADIYDRGKVVHKYAHDEAVAPSAWYYIVSDEDIRYDKLYFTYGSSQRTMGVYRRYGEANGWAMSSVLTEWEENISVVETYYGYLVILLGALILFLLYVLFTLFFRSRKAQICRYKLLGATDSTVAGIYLTIALIVVFFSVALAAGFSVLLSKFMLGLCTKLFGSEYAYHFRIWMPLALFGACALLSAIMFASFRRRISRLPIAQEVRYE